MRMGLGRAQCPEEGVVQKVGQSRAVMGPGWVRLFPVPLGSQQPWAPCCGHAPPRPPGVGPQGLREKGQCTDSEVPAWGPAWWCFSRSPGMGPRGCGAQ